MASEELITLHRAGPFGGLDTTTAQEYVDPKHAHHSSNASTTIEYGALSVAPGRVNLVDFSATAPAFGFGKHILVANFALDGGTTEYPVTIATDGNSTVYYRSDSSSVGAVIINGPGGARNFTWQTAVQIFDMVYFDSGYRWAGPGHDAYYWQYPEPLNGFYAALGLPLVISTGISSFQTTGTILAGGTYEYAITRLNTASTFPATIETSADSLTQQGKSTTIIIPDATAASETGTFSGTPTVGDTVTLSVMDASGNTWFATESINGTMTINDVITFLANGFNNTTYPIGQPPVTAVANGSSLQIIANTAGPDGNTLQFKLAQTGGHIVVSPTAYTNLSGGGGYFAEITIINSSGMAWSGTNPDNSTYTTLIYRQSSNQPGWNLLTADADGNDQPLSGNAVYDDTASDESIAANRELVIYRDPPPMIYPAPQPFISEADQNLPFSPVECHKGFAFVYTIVTALTSGTVRQKQIWYSNADRPWEFNSALSALLIDDGEVPTYDPTGAVPTPQPYGDYPVRCDSIAGSVLLLHSSRSTWVVLGSSADDFNAQRLFNIGYLGGGAKGDGVNFWISERGPELWSGSSPQYIGYAVRSIIRTLTWDDRVAARGAYANFYYYLSFPTKGFTLRYYTISQDWSYLPYAFTEANSSPWDPITYSAPPGSDHRLGEIIALRPGTSNADYWAASPTSDLGGPIIASWTTPLSTGGAPMYEKEYQYLVLYAPVQPYLVSVTVYLDYGLPSAPPAFNVTFDLSGNTTDPSSRQMRKIARLTVDESTTPASTIRAFSAMMIITLITKPEETDPPVIYSAELCGNISRVLQMPSA